MSSFDSIRIGAWHRLALVVSDSAELDIFVDGQKVADNVAWDDGDSIYSNTSVDPSFGEASFSLFGDSGQNHGEGFVSSVAFFDQPLLDELIEAWGGPSAAGIIDTAVSDATSA